MYITNITDDYNCTNIENEHNTIIFKYLLSIPRIILLFSLISLMIYTLNKPLINEKCWRMFYTQLIHLDV